MKLKFFIPLIAFALARGEVHHTTSPVNIVPESASCPVHVQAIPIKSHNGEAQPGGIHQISIRFQSSLLSIAGFEGELHGPTASPAAASSSASGADALDDVKPIHATSHNPDQFLVGGTYWNGKLAYVRWIEFTRAC
jgi:hypothetical protein